MDDILLLIGIPAYFIDSIFLLKPSFNNGAVILICIPIFRVAQVLFQTSFIIDGRRRCSNSSKLQDRKIGRGFVVFLIIANISLWIYNTFSSKSAESYDERQVTHFIGFIKSKDVRWFFKRFQIQLLRLSSLEYFESHLSSVNYVLSVPFIRVPRRNLESCLRATLRYETFLNAK